MAMKYTSIYLNCISIFHLTIYSPSKYYVMYERILSMRQPASASKFNVIGMIDDWGLLTLCTTPPLFGHLLEHQSILTLHPSELGIAWRISCPKQRQRNTIGFDVNLLSDQDHTESNLPSDQISKTRYGGRGRHTRLWLVAELLHTSKTEKSSKICGGG